MGEESMISGGMWWLIGSLSAATFLGTLIVLPVLVIQMAPDYFMPDRNVEASLVRRHPAIRLTVLIAKNVLGYIFIVAGTIMLVTPGQGVLTVLMGLVLTNFPGKRRFELWLVRRRAVIRSINWIRAKAGHPPLQVPDPEPRPLKPDPCSTDRAEPSARD